MWPWVQQYLIVVVECLDVFRVNGIVGGGEAQPDRLILRLLLLLLLVPTSGVLAAVVAPSMATIVLLLLPLEGLGGHGIHELLLTCSERHLELLILGGELLVGGSKAADGGLGAAVGLRQPRDGVVKLHVSLLLLAHLRRGVPKSRLPASLADVDRGLELCSPELRTVCLHLVGILLAMLLLVGLVEEAQVMETWVAMSAMLL